MLPALQVSLHIKLGRGWGALGCLEVGSGARGTVIVLVVLLGGGGGVLLCFGFVSHC